MRMNWSDKTRAALLRCLGAEDFRAAADALRDLSSGDWERLVRKSVNHHVAPLLYRSLKRLGPDVDVPDNVSSRLRGIYQTNTVKNLRVYHELGTVLRGLTMDGVPVIVLKGAHLARFVYGDIGLRQMCDVDILVRKPDLMKTQDRLLGMGYHLPEFTRNNLVHLFPFSKPGVLRMEVHWTLTPETDPLTIDVEGLWERACPVQIGGGEALLLSPEDLLLHQCLHAAYTHGFVLGLKPFCDIAETIRHHGSRIDWVRMRSSARRWKTERCVAVVLCLLEELLAMSAPLRLTGSFEAGGSDAEFVAIARQQIFSVEDDSGTATASLKRSLKPWGRDGFIEKAHRLLKILFLPPENMRAKYQTERLLLSYLIRPFDLLARYLPSARRDSKRESKADGQMLVALKRIENANVIKNWIDSGSSRHDSNP